MLSVLRLKTAFFGVQRALLPAACSVARRRCTCSSLYELGFRVDPRLRRPTGKRPRPAAATLPVTGRCSRGGMALHCCRSHARRATASTGARIISMDLSVVVTTQLCVAFVGKCPSRAKTQTPRDWYECDGFLQALGESDSHSHSSPSDQRLVIPVTDAQPTAEQHLRQFDEYSH